VRYVVEADVSGGAEAYVARLAAAFGGDIVSAGPPPPGLRATEAPRPRGKGDVGALLGLARALRGADLVHVNASEPANNRYGMAAALLARVPYVVTLHSPSGLAGGAQDRVLRRLYGGARAVIAVSQETAGLLREGLGVTASVIPNGVELPPALARRPHARPRVGTLGRLSGEKGVDVLLAAARGLDVEVHVAGDGPERAALQAGAGANVTFHGQVPDPAAFLAGLDVFCLPSRVEGLPFALLEAMASGLAVVATRVGDVPEALGDAGLLVDPGNPVALREALAALARDPLRRNDLGAAARARIAERYTAELMVERTAAVYAAAAGSSPPPRRRRAPAPPPAR
jgi:glycosyltransferase involved in cell wall biosynthesis